MLRIGNMDAVRDYLDVRDVVQAYAALLTKSEPGSVYNVCSGRGVRIDDLRAELVRLAGVTVTTKRDPALDRPAEIPVLIGDHTALTEATGWVPEIPLHEALAAVLAWWEARATARP